MIYIQICIFTIPLQYDPTSTGAARAVGYKPELDGKLDGVAIRVPTPNVSVVDLTFESAKSTTQKEINSYIKQASFSDLKGILGFTEEKLVSTDFNHDPHSSIFAGDQTKVLQNNMVRVLSWYDNEWGFQTECQIQLWKWPNYFDVN